MDLYLALQAARARHQDAEALQAAEQGSSRAHASMVDLKQKHEAHIAELQAFHAAKLQQQAITLAQQPLVRIPQAGQCTWNWPSEC